MSARVPIQMEILLHIPQEKGVLDQNILLKNKSSKISLETKIKTDVQQQLKLSNCQMSLSMTMTMRLKNGQMSLSMTTKIGWTNSNCLYHGQRHFPFKNEAVIAVPY